MKEEFAFKAISLILSKFDLDLRLQDHIGHPKRSFLSSHHMQPLCLIENPSSDMERGIRVMNRKMNTLGHQNER